MQLDGQIVLCGHSDSTFPRNYDGALSHLSIYDNALNSSQVLALFHQVCSLLCQMQTVGMLGHPQTEGQREVYYMGTYLLASNTQDQQDTSAAAVMQFAAAATQCAEQGGLLTPLGTKHIVCKSYGS